MRSTMPGRLSSSHDLSSGRSISFTRSSSVRAFCTSTVWASALKAESTAAEVCDDISPRSNAEGCGAGCGRRRSEEHTSELQSHVNLVCRLLLEKKKNRAQLQSGTCQ